MGTATLEVKLDQELLGIFHETLFQVFLDVGKPLTRWIGEGA